jgi:hypothetical protein
VSTSSPLTIVVQSCYHIGATSLTSSIQFSIDEQGDYQNSIMGYSRSELLSFNMGTSSRLPQDTWRTIVSLDINAVKPTHRGSKGSKIKSQNEQNIPTDRQTTGITNSVKLGVWNAQSIRNKTTMFTEYMLDLDIDCSFLVETWLTENDHVVIKELTLPGFSFISVPRNSTTYGGGVGVLFKSELNIQIFDIGLHYRTFEYACFTDARKDVFYFLIYRPFPSAKNGLKTPEFLSDFDNLIEFVNTMASKIIILGDINLHVNIPSKPEVSHFLTTLDNAGFQQHIHEPTHVNGNTLDLVISRADEDLVTNCSVEARLSDHNVSHFIYNSRSLVIGQKRSGLLLVD